MGQLKVQESINSAISRGVEETNTSRTAGARKGVIAPNSSPLAGRTIAGVKTSDFALQLKFLTEEVRKSLGNVAALAAKTTSELNQAKKLVQDLLGDVHTAPDEKEQLSSTGAIIDLAQTKITHEEQLAASNILMARLKGNIKPAEEAQKFEQSLQELKSSLANIQKFLQEFKREVQSRAAASPQQQQTVSSDSTDSSSTGSSMSSQQKEKLTRADGNQAGNKVVDQKNQQIAQQDKLRETGNREHDLHEKNIGLQKQFATDREKEIDGAQKNASVA